MDDTVDRLKKALTYTGISAVKAIFDELGEEDEKIIVAAKLASEKSLARSVMVYALKLLYATGVLETESVGAKGTHIRVLNREVLEAVAKV